MKTLHVATLGFTAAICISNPAFAQNGYDHRSYENPNGASRSGYDFGPERSHGLRNSCSPQGCPCSANNTTYTPRLKKSAPLPAFHRPAANRAYTNLEAGLSRLGDDLRDETRGLPGYAVLMEDFSQLHSEAKHFEQSVESWANWNHLREDAVRVKRSLIQLNADMRREGRFPESERSLVEFVRVFAVMVDNLGLSQLAPSDQSVPSKAPIYAPRGNGITPPIETPQPLIQPMPSRHPLTRAIPKGMEGIAKISASDQVSALAQATCPVTKQKLGSMGKPIRVTVAGRSLWVCCQGCVDTVKSNPGQFFRPLR